MEPSTSKFLPWKNPPGKMVRPEQKVIIINIYQEKLAENPEAKHGQLVAMVSKTCGIGGRTICKILAEYKKTGTIAPPKKRRQKLGVIDKLTEDQKMKIHEHYQNFRLRREMPSLQKMLALVNEDEELPKFSKSNFSRILRKLNLTISCSRWNTAIKPKKQKTPKPVNNVVVDDVAVNDVALEEEVITIKEEFPPAEY